MIKDVENDTPNDTQTIPHTYNVYIYTLCICILDFGFSWGVPNDTPNDTQTIHQTIPSTHACHTISHFRSARHPPLRTSMTSLLLSLLALACAGGQLCRCLCWRCWWCLRCSGAWCRCWGVSVWCLVLLVWCLVSLVVVLLPLLLLLLLGAGAAAAAVGAAAGGSGGGGGGGGAPAPLQSSSSESSSSTSSAVEEGDKEYLK